MVSEIEKLRIRLKEQNDYVTANFLFWDLKTFDEEFRELRNLRIRLNAYKKGLL